MFHFDLYRIENPRELAELGIDDALDDGVVLVEWPERGFPQRLAADALTVTLTQDRRKHARGADFRPRALGRIYRGGCMNLVTDSRQEAMTVFLADSGWGTAELKPLPGDASTRRYVRLHDGRPDGDADGSAAECRSPDSGPRCDARGAPGARLQRAGAARRCGLRALRRHRALSQRLRPRGARDPGRRRRAGIPGARRSGR